MRQHVNPLSRFFQLSRNLPGPAELFEKSDLPIHLDIGCARGDFLLNMANIHQNWNYLGLDIRFPLVESANKDKYARNLGNLAFLFCNANVSLDEWLVALPRCQLQRVSIQFPDPWFKRRHRKRRVLQASLMIALSNTLQVDSELFIQTDLLSLLNQMKTLIELTECFNLHKDYRLDLKGPNPFNVSTEREKYVLKRGLPVYRLLYLRNNKPPDPSLIERKWRQIEEAN